MPELSIVIPVLNERDNIRPLVEQLRCSLGALDWEIVFVDDDSPDETADICRAQAAGDPRVRVIQRIARSGLASACVEGMMATCAPWLAVMDGDLQHDPAVLPRMLEVAKQGSYDVVVASRHADGGSVGSFGSGRRWLSNVGRRLSSAVLRAELTDPMSGYFLVSRKYVHEVVHDLSVLGFKILLDLVASSRRAVRIAEVPYEFRMREHGVSKLDASVCVDFLVLVADKAAGDVIPIRFGMYALVGLFGMAVHVSVLTAVYSYDPGPGIVAAQSIATAAAILSNFFLNNHITFRDRRLRGWKSISLGLFWYLIVCSVGAFVNLATTRLLADVGTSWLMSGAVGMCISAVWNYAAASMLLWKIERRRARRRQRSHAEANVVLSVRANW